MPTLDSKALRCVDCTCTQKINFKSIMYACIYVHYVRKLKPMYFSFQLTIACMQKEVNNMCTVSRSIGFVLFTLKIFSMHGCCILYKYARKLHRNWLKVSDYVVSLDLLFQIVWTWKSEQNVRLTGTSLSLHGRIKHTRLTTKGKSNWLGRCGVNKKHLFVVLTWFTTCTQFGNAWLRNLEYVFAMSLKRSIQFSSIVQQK